VAVIILYIYVTKRSLICHKFSRHCTGLKLF